MFQTEQCRADWAVLVLINLAASKAASLKQTPMQLKDVLCLGLMVQTVDVLSDTGDFLSHGSKSLLKNRHRKVCIVRSLRLHHLSAI